MTFFSSIYHEEFNDKEILGIIWTVSNLYLEFKNYKFTRQFMRGVAGNLTQFEGINIFRFPYLWLNFNKAFFNPFDKGSFFKNFKDVYASYVISVCTKLLFQTST